MGVLVGHGKGFGSTFSRIIERVIHTRRRTSNDQQIVEYTCSANCAVHCRDRFIAQQAGLWNAKSPFLRLR